MQSGSKYPLTFRSLARSITSKTLRVPLQCAVLACASLLSSATLVHADESNYALGSSVSKWPYRWQVGNFNIYSTVTEASLRSTSEQLLALGPQIESTLGVKLNASDVHLVVLANQPEFEQYLKTHFPSLPNRRALYVQRRGMGVVITYYHSDWLTDARHECTHALLHQSGIHLPLWLDEGVAEYFENHGPDPRHHPEHRNAIQTQLRFGQIVQVDDFENSNLTTLESNDYKNSWGVVNFLIHHSDETRQGLSTYINDLHCGTAAGYLSHRLSLPIRRNWRRHFETFYTPTGNGATLARSLSKQP